MYRLLFLYLPLKAMSASAELVGTEFHEAMTETTENQDQMLMNEHLINAILVVLIALLFVLYYFIFRRKKSMDLNKA